MAVEEVIMSYWFPRLINIILGLGVATGLVLTGCGAAAIDKPGSGGDSLPFQLIHEAAPLGDQPEQPLYMVVSGLEAWETLSGSLPPEAISAGMQAAADPQNLILVVYAGRQPSSGYSIAVEGIYPQEDVYLVRVEEILPNPEQITEPAVTLPYQIVAISKKEFPEVADITFVFQDTQNKELARITITTEAAYPVP